MMDTNSPDDNLRVIWREQRREHTIMSEAEVRTRAHAFQMRIHRNLLLAFVLCLGLLALCTMAIKELGNLTPRIIAGAMTVVIALIAFRTFRRIWSPQILSPDIGRSACLEFYRNELRTEYRTLVLKWRLLVAIAFFLWLTWNSLFRSPLLLRMLLPSSLVLILFVRRREAQKLKRELASVSAFEREETSTI
jgi:hypothetical protein